MDIAIYINDIRLDVFKDEAITINDVIQDIKDISKVFVPYTQSFSVPASPTNSKIFKHYYNADIIDGFDARIRVAGEIKLNGADWKTGKIQLVGVQLKNQIANNYKIIFYGDTADLNEIFAQQQLNSLFPLSTYDFSSTTGDILSAFKDGLTTTGVTATLLENRNVVVPLITLQNYYQYITSVIATPNLWDVVFTDLKKELKPAIKVKRIIEAIETQYDIEFNMVDEGSIISFFDCDMFEELYLWLHREKTAYTDPQDTTKYYGINYQQFSKKLTFADYTYIGGSGDVLTGNTLVVNTGESYSLRFRFICTTTDAPLELIVRDKNTNELLFSKKTTTVASPTPTSITITGITSGTLAQRIYDLEIRFNNNNTQALTFIAQSTYPSAFGLEIDKTVAAVTTQHFYGNSAFTLAGNVYIQDYLPKMKIIDFLSGLFKTFNLTAYTIPGSSKIYVQTWDDYMTQGTTRDITKYIDVSKKTVNRPIPYSQIDFSYGKAVTNSSLRYLNQFSLEFGNLNYSAPEDYQGQSFDLKTPFQHTVLNNPSNSDNIFAWWTDAKGDTTLGKPYIFFNKVLDSTSNPITTLTLTQYMAPSNVTEDENHTLNFGAEYDEVNEVVNTNSLFARFYQQYIVQAFKEQGRIISIDAFLSLDILLSYSLNDTIRIGGRDYYINKIKTNLLTKKASLELITKIDSYTASVLT
tara:strand:+ start:9379 stop:11463 length:2085 start_codon:yes stop_codon:yes gene_type:complete